MLTLPRPALVVVALVTAVRIFVAFHFPLTEDESYYWSWSRHPAFGYVDHPPMVAWLIALTAPLGRDPGWVRLPFILCEGATALVLARTALVVGGSACAATAAAVAFTAIPQIRLAIGEALPDGPYLLCWALALLFTAKLGRAREAQPDWGDAAALGLALGGTLLSRVFGWALVFGVAAYALGPSRRVLWRRGLWLALALALALYAPFIVWNATHQWVNFTFAVRDRQQFGAFSVTNVSVLSSARFLVYAIAVWILGVGVALRPRRALIAWTALPFPTFLAGLSFFETVESYWLLGPFTSLCTGIGLSYARLSLRWRRALWVLLVPAVYTIVSALFVTLPEGGQRALLQATHGGAQAMYSNVFAYAPFARDVRALSAGRTPLVITDQFEVASELAYYGLDPLVIGESSHAQQSLAWHGPLDVPAQVLFVSLNPPAADEDLSRRLAEAFSRVSPGPTFHYRYAGVDAMTFYTAWCETPKAHAGQTLFAPDLALAGEHS
ncbi:MAG TPA: glycosyltransferase family 39 protein [Candidatus Acidoferrales bacterium]|nr:glycosyltransferase family 39 protein [Candidatus Acidoferrales bacterium]